MKHEKPSSLTAMHAAMKLLYKRQEKRRGLVFQPSTAANILFHIYTVQSFTPPATEMPY